MRKETQTRGLFTFQSTPENAKSSVALPPFFFILAVVSLFKELLFSSPLALLSLLPLFFRLVHLNFGN
jgi:hypothetical protein